jgi:hypothetical protein
LPKHRRMLPPCRAPTWVSPRRPHLVGRVRHRRLVLDPTALLHLVCQQAQATHATMAVQCTVTTNPLRASVPPSTRPWPWAEPSALAHSPDWPTTITGR